MIYVYQIVIPNILYIMRIIILLQTRNANTL